MSLAAANSILPDGAKSLWIAAGIQTRWAKFAEQDGWADRMERRWQALRPAEQSRAVVLARMAAFHTQEKLLVHLVGGGDARRWDIAHACLEHYLEAGTLEARRNVYVQAFRDLGALGMQRQVTYPKLAFAGVLALGYCSVLAGDSGQFLASAAGALGLHAGWLAATSAAWMKTGLAKGLAVKNLTTLFDLVKSRAINRVADLAIHRAESPAARDAIELAAMLAKASSSVAIEHGLDGLKDATQVPPTDHGIVEIAPWSGSTQTVEISEKASGSAAVYAGDFKEVAVEVLDESSDEASRLWDRVGGPLFNYASRIWEATHGDAIAHDVCAASLEILGAERDRRAGWSHRTPAETLLARKSEPGVSLQDVILTLHLSDTKYAEYRNADTLGRMGILAKYVAPDVLQRAANACGGLLDVQTHALAFLSHAVERSTSAARLVERVARSVIPSRDSDDQESAPSTS